MIESVERTYSNELFTAQGTVTLSDNLHTLMNMSEFAGLNDLPVVNSAVDYVSQFTSAFSFAVPALSMIAGVFSGSSFTPEQVTQNLITEIGSVLSKQLTQVSQQIDTLKNQLVDTIDEQSANIITAANIERFTDAKMNQAASDYFNQVYNEKLNQVISDYEAESRSIEQNTIAKKMKYYSNTQTRFSLL